jgi:hypothetical protein
VQDDDDLKLFETNIGKFNRKFCDAMSDKSDFTLELQVKGNRGKIDVCKITYNEFDRPEKGK